MTRTEVQLAARLALTQRQRRFEWELARDELARAANRLVAGKTHDLLNLVQIVQLATYELAHQCAPSARELLDDLMRAADDAKADLLALLEVARPTQVIVRGPPVGAAVAGLLGELRAAVELDAHLAIDPDVATALDARALTHLVLGLVLDAVDSPRVELFVRDRALRDGATDGKGWVELVCGADVPAAPAAPGDDFELRIVELLAQRAGGEVARSDRRGGGREVVVGLPALAAAPGGRAGRARRG